MFAGHLPTKTFSQNDWLSMPVFEPKNKGDFPPETGFYRDRGRGGKPIVFWFDWADITGGYAVRPIVRVKMGRG